MKTIKIPYGNGTQTVHVPQERLQDILMPKHGKTLNKTQREIVSDALAHPIASLPLEELAKGKQRVLIITSDHTRPVPSRITMPMLLEKVRSGNPDAQITILIATGMHRPTTEAELLDKFGEEIVAKEHIVVHRCDEDDNMVKLGMLPSGGELWLNKLILKNELVLSEGFIEPHFFAGFSGGRKSILPGIAAKKTVLYNHNARFLQSPYAHQGSLEKNPIHQDMLYAAEQAGLAFILNVLIDGDKNIIAAVAGDRVEAHKAGCAICAEMTSVSASPADIVITSNGGYPLDQNVYQSVKGMTAAEAAVRQDGVIIMCAALNDGAGGDDFYHWFADRKGPEDVAKDICNIPPEETLLDQWEAQLLARVMCKAQCIFVTGKENRALIEAMHMRWAENADAALEMAFETVGREASVTIIPDGVGVIL